MEVIISIVILSVVMVALLKIKSENISIVSKSEQKIKLNEYILLAINFEDIENKNEEISLEKYKYENDDLRKELKDIKVSIKDEKIDTRTIMNGSNNINVTYGVNVDNIDSIKKELKLSNGDSKKYDKLILANGSRANIPPILGVEKMGTFVLRSKKDADRIKEYAKNSTRVVIVGGGVLGLEAASELKKLGLNVIIVEMASRIFPRQLDEEASKLFEEVISKEDIKIYKNHFVKAIGGENKVEFVELDNGKEIKADMVLISSGIKANTQIVTGSPIKSNYGIIVDEKMNTSEKDIFACGDIAEFEGIVTGLWATALEQGNVAGANAVGDFLTFKASIQPVTFSGLNTSIFSIGDIGSDPDKEYGISVYLDKKNRIYKKLYFTNDKFVGGILCGDISKSSALLSALKDESEMKDLVKKVF